MLELERLNLNSDYSASINSKLYSTIDWRFVPQIHMFKPILSMWWYLEVWPLEGASQVALVVKHPPATAGDKRDTVLISESGRSPREGHGNPLQYLCLENPMDTGAWWATVHSVTKRWTWLKWLNTFKMERSYGTLEQFCIMFIWYCNC